LRIGEHFVVSCSSYFFVCVAFHERAFADGARTGLFAHVGHQNFTPISPRFHPVSKFHPNFTPIFTPFQNFTPIKTQRIPTPPGGSGEEKKKKRGILSKFRFVKNPN
jgi:hypothetical protein